MPSVAGVTTRGLARRPKRARTPAINKARRGALLCLIAGIWCTPSSAVELPLGVLFRGPSTPSVIEDAEHYPDSYLSIDIGYWDIYHERRPGKLHDYHQDDQRLTALRRTGRLLLGVRLTRSALVAEQENAYTDADRMEGEGRVEAGQLLLGSARIRGDFRGGVKGLQMVGAAGWRNGFSGDIEALVDWGRYASLLLRGQTAKSRLDVHEEINGFRFPFVFPFRTNRVCGAVESRPRDALNARVWGALEKSSGRGEAAMGFENRPSFAGYSLGTRLDFRLETHDRFQNTPRLPRDDGKTPGLRLTTTHHRGAFDLGMYFQETRYLRIDDLRLEDTALRLDVVPFRWGSFFGGWQRIRVEHDGDSFFDVWPFTVWDAFAAKRYRLGDTDLRLDTWYAGMGLLVESRRLEFDVSWRFEWWRDRSSLSLYERVNVVFPFFFTYERTTNDVDIPAKYAVQIDPSFLFRPARALSVRLSGRIAFPFGSDKGAPSGQVGDPTSDRPSESSTHGGIMGRLEVILAL